MGRRYRGRKRFCCRLALLSLEPDGVAKDNVMSGTIVSENSVHCGTRQREKKADDGLMCQEYVIRTQTTEYHVRQEKQDTKRCCR